MFGTIGYNFYLVNMFVINDLCVFLSVLFYLADRV